MERYDLHFIHPFILWYCWGDPQGPVVIAMHLQMWTYAFGFLGTEGEVEHTTETQLDTEINMQTPHNPGNVTFLLWGKCASHSTSKIIKARTDDIMMLSVISLSLSAAWDLFSVCFEICSLSGAKKPNNINACFVWEQWTSDRAEGGCGTASLTIKET